MIEVVVDAAASCCLGHGEVLTYELLEIESIVRRCGCFVLVVLVCERCLDAIRYREEVLIYKF